MARSHAEWRQTRRPLIAWYRAVVDDIPATARRRSATYGALLVVSLVCYGPLQAFTWHGDTELDTLLDLSAALLALIVGIMVLLRYYSKKSSTFLLIGSGLLGTGLLDSAHTVVTSRLFGGGPLLSSSALLPWSWVASRLFLAALLWLSCVIWRREVARKESLHISERAVYLSVAVLTLASFALYFFVRLPQAYFPRAVGRPEDLLPAFFFLLALLGYLRKRRWQSDGFEHWLVLSLIVSLMCHVFMALSRQPFDVLFYVAHGLKVLSYVCVLVGTFTSMYDIFRKAEQSAVALARINDALQIEIGEHARCERALAQHAAELEAFSYSVSHDLRAPLRRIDGFCQILLDDCAQHLDAQSIDYLQRMGAASRHAEQLVTDILKLSSVTRGTLHGETVNLSALAGKITAELRLAEPGRAVDFVLTGGLFAQGDGRLLQVLLENLLSNAWKFTRKQPRARIEFGVTRYASETCYVVRDNGVGFDMAYAGQLFRPFQRLHGAADFEGTGIGLATVQRIAHRHGGRVWAEGAMNEGATFFFTLAEAPQGARPPGWGGPDTIDHDASVPYSITAGASSYGAYRR